MMVMYYNNNNNNIKVAGPNGRAVWGTKEGYPNVSGLSR
jgi:hypothetical protein